MIFLEEDMPKNITTRYIGDDQSEWIPQENDTLEDLIKLKKMNESRMFLEQEPEVVNWKELYKKIDEMEKQSI